MRTLAGALLGGALTLASGGLALAQASPSPDGGTTAGLRSVLGRVPAGPDAWGPTVSYADLRAVVDARRGAAHPADLAELLAALDADDPAAERWMAAMMGLSSGSGELYRGLLGNGQAWPSVVGFDPTQIDRVLAFGMPPAAGTVVEGRFDPAAIGAALAARGFEAHPFGSFNGWCSPDGCDAGMRLDIQHRDPADPFGGQLGRRQPLAVSSEALLSSASDLVVTGMVDASEGLVPSLAQEPAVATILDALDAGADVRLLQAELLPGSLVQLDPGVLLGSSGSPEQIREVLARLAEGFEPIAPASVLAIVDGATDTEQVVRLVLAYDRPADAEQAATVIPKRLATMTSLVTGQPWQQLLDDRGVTSVEGAAVPAGDGAAAVITVRAPLAGDEPDPGSGRLVASSRLHSLFMRGLATRDLVWLIPSLPEAP